MSTTPKKIVGDFLAADIVNDATILERFIHPDVELVWSASDGNSIMDYKALDRFYAEVRKAYEDLQIEVSHILESGDHVTVRYKYNARTVENPDEEIGIAHFMVIWQIKDGKLYRGYQITQPISQSNDKQLSYGAVKM